jgi:hypothetical protein
VRGLRPLEREPSYGAAFVVLRLHVGHLPPTEPAWNPAKPLSGSHQVLNATKFDAKGRRAQTNRQMKPDTRGIKGAPGTRRDCPLMLSLASMRRGKSCG